MFFSRYILSVNCCSLSALHFSSRILDFCLYIVVPFLYNENIKTFSIQMACKFFSQFFLLTLLIVSSFNVFNAYVAKSVDLIPYGFGGLCHG